ncbi:uncharacterized protein SCHCODRAFT_02212745 [Schizophyllum commune H4-8]|uniref:uncharacterized protein n=1 Tax=Schizophyllum commune (strain H4-8 / FGSC 9210) TaxID=578458 RepID=UPI00215EAD33|nr:uncharacterized protein SCHCODRAFT_02212745 [Schizophyllum commune H4-8]KAI5894599.1 hypothetical protein SCHCODRAFT_02212745 [Schizophyllum commune H4-8]
MIVHLAARYPLTFLVHPLSVFSVRRAPHRPTVQPCLSRHSFSLGVFAALWTPSPCRSIARAAIRPPSSHSSTPVCEEDASPHLPLPTSSVGRRDRGSCTRPSGPSTYHIVASRNERPSNLRELLACSVRGIQRRLGP